MLHRLPRALRPPQQQRPAPRRRPQRQLIQRQALPAGLLDAGARRGREVERRDRELGGHGQQADVVGDGADDDDGLVGGRGALLVGGAAAGGEHGEAGEGERGAVGAGHEEPAEDDFVEVRVGFAYGLEEGGVGVRRGGVFLVWGGGGREGWKGWGWTYGLGSGRA